MASQLTTQLADDSAGDILQLEARHRGRGPGCIQPGLDGIPREGLCQPPLEPDGACAQQSLPASFLHHPFMPSSKSRDFHLLVSFHGPPLSSRSSATHALPIYVTRSGKRYHSVQNFEIA